MSDEEQDDDKNYVFIRAECGCRFQVVSGLPVLNAGVLAIPDVAENVCENHRARQEEAQKKKQEEATKPKIALVRADGSPIDGSGRTVVRRN